MAKTWHSLVHTKLSACFNLLNVGQLWRYNNDFVRCINWGWLSSSFVASTVIWPDPMWCFLMWLCQRSCVHAPFAMWFSTAAREDHTYNRWYWPWDVRTCVARAWLLDWYLPRHQRWTYGTPIKCKLRCERNSIHLYKCFRYVCHSFYSINLRNHVKIIWLSNHESQQTPFCLELIWPWLIYAVLNKQKMYYWRWT